MPRFRPADSDQQPFFSGIRTFLRLPHRTALDDVDVAIVGVPFDASTSFRPGARFGPEAIRSSSVLLGSYHAPLDVPVFDVLSAIDYGDAPVSALSVEDTYALCEPTFRHLQQSGVLPIALGGDHSITLPQLRAAHARHGPLGLVLFDSHPDTWDRYCGRRHWHGATFRRAVEEGLVAPQRSVMCGIRGTTDSPDDWGAARDLGFELVTATAMHANGIDGLPAHILARTGGGATFLSFDIDFLDPAFAPGTGTPAVGGFSTAQALFLLRGLTGLDVVGADVVEVLPAMDVGGITSLAAASIVFEILTLIAWQRRSRPA